MGEVKRDLAVFGLSRMPHEEAFALQSRLRERCTRSEGTENFLILVEHPPVVTVGRSGSLTDVCVSSERLGELGVSLVETNRGGGVTFHGPGQLVMYPIVDLRPRGRDLHRYLRDLEGWLVRLCLSYGVDAAADEEYTGVWVEGSKIAAIGVAVRAWVSYHGVALNVSTDLTYFDLIVPCGIKGRGVTSMAEILGAAPAMEEVAGRAAGLFCDEFGFEAVQWTAATAK